jgi:N4-gp56 family major capsid protein
MAYTTVTIVDGGVDVIMQETLLRNAKARCPYFIGSTPAEITAHQGSVTAKWRRVENLSVSLTPLTALTGTEDYPTRTGSTPTVNDITAALLKFGNHIILNEEVQVVNFNPVADKYAEILGINAGQVLNRLQRNELEDNSTIEYGGSITAESVVIAKMVVGDITKVVNLLDRASALKFTPMTTGSPNTNTTPQRDAYWGICHPDVEIDIRAMTAFVPVEQYASQTVTEKGEFGSVGGVRFLSTPESSIDTGIGATGATDVRETTVKADVYNTVIFGMDHHGSVGLGFNHTKNIYNAGDTLPGVQMISHGPGSAGTADPLDEVSTLGWKTWHVPKVFTNSTTPATGEWGYVVRTAASVLA